MDEGEDVGYHSSDNSDAQSGEDVEENMMFQDLNYDVAESTLDEPDYDAIREGRFKRNQDAMKALNAHIAYSMPYSNTSYNLTPEDNAAIVIQKHIRGFLAQRKYIELLMEQFEKEEKLRREKTMEQVQEAKLLIQNHQLEVQFEEYGVIRKNRGQRLVCSAITIQRAWRNYLTVKADQSAIQKETVFDGMLDMCATQLAEHALQHALSELLLASEE